MFKLLLFALLAYLALRAVVRLVAAARADGIDAAPPMGRMPDVPPPQNQRKRALEIEDARFRDV